ncbi:MAG TPA: GyrI-like domain-containing protein [Candidatus Izemoplasmatales bacterium]|nr:GyrI-like domain-containing protein [Candidatus Izemoplasmatales bacterium]
MILMFDVRIVDKPAFAVIGKEGAGPSQDSLSWIAPLWKSANEHFSEIANFAKKADDGRLSGFWGAMTDMDRTDRPWRDGRGRYLAGCETWWEAKAPEGWSRWVIPSFRFAVVHCTMRTYAEAMRYMTKEYLPSQGHLLVGAIQESYLPLYPQGELDLYFPIEKGQ